MINVWVYLEHYEENIEDVSLEIIGGLKEIGKDLEMKITGFMLGDDPKSIPEIAISYGADDVIFFRNKFFKDYDTQAFVYGVQNTIIGKKPDIILFGATYQGRDFAGRLATKLKTGLAANAITLRIDNNGTLYTGVPGYGGRFIAEIVNFKAKPQISTVRQGIFKKNFIGNEKRGNVEIIDVDLGDFIPKVVVMQRVKKEIVDITKSEKVVIVGNGAGDKFEMIEKFAKLIGADIGVTRPIADRGLAPRDIQVGSTGVSLRSKLAIVLGSSGSEHFVSGIEKCEQVISIDIDRNSNIFNHSDYCIVNDIFKILPLIINKIEGEK